MRTFLVLGVSAAACIGLVVACSSDDDSGGAGSSSGSSTSSSGDGSSSSSSSSSSGGTDAGLKGAGQITVTSSTGAGGSLNAVFTKAGEASLPACTRTTIGSCLVSECPLPVPPAPDAGAPVIISAGGMTVTGGTIPAPGITIQPDAKTFYAGSSAVPLWAGGEKLTFVLGGAEIPGFTQVTDTPGAVNITSPTLPAPAGTDVPRANDFVITWTTGTDTGSAGDLSATIGSGNSTTAASMVCRFPISAKTGSIPSAALAKMIGPSGSFLLGTISESEVVQNGYLIRTSLGSLARANGEEVLLNNTLNFK